MVRWEVQPLSPMAFLFGITSGNVVARGDGFVVSFNPETDVGAETALCKDGEYFILLGDFRKQYAKLIPRGFAACKAFYDASDAERSSWSD